MENVKQLVISKVEDLNNLSFENNKLIGEKIEIDIDTLDQKIYKN